MYIAPDTTTPTAPEACPFCQSPHITTTTKTVTVSTYWRCTGCGQIWNVARLQPASRWPYGRVPRT